MNTMIIAALTASLLGTSATQAAAANPCDAPGARGEGLLETWARAWQPSGALPPRTSAGPSRSRPASTRPAVREAAIQQMMKSLRQGRDDSRADGPRHIASAQPARHAVGTDGPVFRTAVPMRTDDIDVTLSPTRGSGKVQVLICKESPSGERSKLGSLELDYGKGKLGTI